MPADIRTARASDVDSLSAIENAVFEGDRISRGSFRRLITRDSARLLVMENGGTVAGYCAVLFRAGSGVARLYSVAAAPGRHGIGHVLLGAAEEAARSRGCGRLRLEVRRDNLRAIGLYERSGYRRIGEVAGYYVDGETALRYEKHLAASAAGQGAGPARMGTAA